MPYADLGNVRLFYTIGGAGDPTVLFVHGWGCDSHDWTRQLPDFSRSHRVVAVDLRGHGHSSPSVDGYGVHSHVADLAKLLGMLDCGPVVAVGHSLGGLLVSMLAVEHPSFVSAVVVVDPGYGLTDVARSGLTRLIARMQLPDGYNAALEIMAGLEAPSTHETLVVWHRRRVLATPLDVLAATSQSTIVAAEQVFRPQSQRYMSMRRCPVFSLYRDPERAKWESTVRSHPRSRQLAWEGCGHWLHQERPTEFNADVLDWISQLATIDVGSVE
jgi:pimeloyl-ACP methyl ester carboxylesterase